MGMGRDRVPEDHPPLGAQLFEDAVDDCAGWFFPRSRAATRPPEGSAPEQQVELAGEGNARPAHALVARRLPDGDDIGLAPVLDVMPEIGEPDRWRVRDIVGAGVPNMVEGGPSRQRRELAEQGLERGRLATIRQWS